MKVYYQYLMIEWVVIASNDSTSPRKLNRERVWLPQGSLPPWENKKIRRQLDYSSINDNDDDMA